MADVQPVDVSIKIGSKVSTNPPPASSSGPGGDNIAEKIRKAKSMKPRQRPKPLEKKKRAGPSPGTLKIGRRKSLVGTVNEQSEDVGSDQAERLSSAAGAMLKINHDVEKGSTVHVIERTKCSYNLLHIFDVWDWDADRFVTLEDVQLGMRKGGIKMSMAKLRGCVSGTTKRNDGKIYNTEFARVMMRLANHDLAVLDAWCEQITDNLPVCALRDVRAASPRFQKKVMEEEEARRRKRSSSLGAESKAKPRGARRRMTDTQADNLLSRSKTAAASVRERLEAAGMRVDGFARLLGGALTFQAGYLPAVAAILAWQWTFTLWYYLFNNFGIAQAFYYAAQSGFSVGFGALNEACDTGICADDLDGDGSPDNRMSEGRVQASHAMTVLNVLLGSSVIGGALSFFTAHMIDQRTDWEDDVAEQARRERLRAGGERRGVGGGNSKVGGGGSGEEAKCGACGAIAAKLNFLGASLEQWKIIAVIITVLGSAVVFGVAHEEWPFITSVYFAVTSVSTAGLQGVNDPSDDFSMWFTGLLVYVGVPTYAAALGLLAGALTEHVERAKLEASLNERMSAAEFRCAARKEDGSDTLDFTEFLEMELLRTGKVDNAFLDHVRRLFDKYDTTKDGVITIEEMVAGNVFSMFNTLTPDNDTLDFEEFSACVVALRANIDALGGSAAEVSAEELRATFDDANTSGDDSISMQEFLVWVKTTMVAGPEADGGS
jgi:Ca2+-binding EF-hand superfamily protein